MVFQVASVSETDEQDVIFEEMETLSRQITYHADLFFNKDRQEIPNHVYDEMVVRWDELAEARPDLAELFAIHNRPVPIHTPTNEGLEVIKFDQPMISLKKVYSMEEVEEFQKKFPPDTFYWYEVKLDGIALSVRYENWRRVGMFTRGSGLDGEDVTHSIRLFDDSIPEYLPHHWPSDMEIRGEGVISYENFRQYNETSTKEKANPRNAVSGWVRALLKNQDEAVLGMLSFRIYWSDNNLGQTEYSHLLGEWTEAGFVPAPPCTIEDIKENREDIHWPSDGIVIKHNDLNVVAELGHNNRFSHSARAYKFPFAEATTPFETIDWATSKVGRVVPTGIYQAIKLGGVWCSRALIHNYRNFMELGLREDSKVVITRNGDVIPQVSVVADHGTGKMLEAPTECPDCGSVLELRVTKTSADLFCNNVSGCPGQLLMRCLAMVGKRCLDIRGIGPIVMGRLIDQGHVNRPADIFAVEYPWLNNVNLDSVRCAKEQPLDRIICALGLPNVSLTRARKLAVAWGSGSSPALLDWFGDVDNIIKISGFSAGLAVPIAETAKDPDWRDNALLLLSTLKEVPMAFLDSGLKGCVTGELGQPRDLLTRYFEHHGVELVNTVSKDCNFLIVGEKPSNSKLLKATELGIRIVNGTQVDSIDTLIKHLKQGAV